MVAAFSAIFGQRNDQLKPLRRDIAPVVLSNIEHVSYERFTDYSHDLQKQYDRYESHRNRPVSPRASQQDIAPATPDAAQIPERRPSYSQSPSRTNTRGDQSIYTGNIRAPSARNMESPLKFLRRASGTSKGQTTIPRIYFEEDFSLENPKTFEDVSDHSDIVDNEASASRSAKRVFANNAMLQEKLSWYLDMVEIDLIRETNNSSMSFFAALSDLQDIEQHSHNCVQRIMYLRDELEPINSMQAQSGIEVHRLETRRSNLTKLVHELAELTDMRKSISDDRHAEMGIGQQIQYLRSLRDDIASKPMTAMIVAQQVQDLINEKVNNLGASCSDDFVHGLLSDMRSTIEGNDALIEYQSAIFADFDARRKGSRSSKRVNEFISRHEDIRHSILDKVGVLSQCSLLEQCLLGYRDAVQKEFRSVVKRYLPVEGDVESVRSSDTPNRPYGPRGQQLAESLRRQNADDFLRMTSRILCTTSLFLRRLCYHVKAILDAISYLPRESRLVDDELMHYEVELNDLVSSATDITLVRFTKVLNARFGPISQYSFDDFSSLYKVVHVYLLDIESLSGTEGGPLPASLEKQCLQVYNTHREDMLSKQAKYLEDDVWEHCNVTDPVQKSVNGVLAAAHEDPPDWEVPVANEPSMQRIESAETIAPDSSKMLLLGNEAVFLTTSGQYLVRSVTIYGRWMKLVTGKASIDIALGLCQHLKMFNSRTRQMILGAGATRTAGLRSIVAKHIALASQTLQLAASLTESMWRFSHRHVPTGSYDRVDSDFKSVAREIADHQQDIDNKFVDIMRDRVSHASKELHHSTNWDATDEASPYMRTLMKDASRLNRVLQRYFGLSTRGIMESVLVMIERQLSSDYDDVGGPVPIKQIERDIDYYFHTIREWKVEPPPGAFAKFVQGQDAADVTEDTRADAKDVTETEEH